MAVDLHTHSRLSDGGVVPEAIIDMAVQRGLAAVALTDHDLIDGNGAAAAAAEDRIAFVPGVELSVEWERRGMHLLVYWVEEDTPLGERLEGIRNVRQRRNLEIVDALQGLGIDVTLEEVEAEAEIGVIGRPHFAGVLVERGVVADVPEAFDRYLAVGRPAYRRRERVSAAETIDLAWESGAVPVVAHPHTLADGRDQFTRLFPTLAALGVAGVECHYVEYPPRVRASAAALAEREGLVPTGGSDYHGRYKPGIEVGVGRGDLEVPDEAVERLWERRRS